MKEILIKIQTTLIRKEKNKILLIILWNWIVLGIHNRQIF